jgi:hypothetical protein
VPITYTNAKEQTYFLHQGRTKTGNPTYYFSLKRDGHLADAIPLGYEIYENPNGQVFLRKIPPQLITDAERQVVVDGMSRYASGEAYKIDVKGTVLAIYLADQDRHALARFVEEYPSDTQDKERMMQLLQRQVHYSPMLQFILVDVQQRLFAVQRYCFRGAIDDWINIGLPNTLAHGVKTFVKHLGKASYFELW